MVHTAPGAGCVTLAVELQHGDRQQWAACPGAAGAAPFALPIFGAGSGAVVGRLSVTQPAGPGRPGRQWQQLFSGRGAIQLAVDMRQAAELPALQPQPAPAAAAAAPAATAGCHCRRPTCTQLEDFGHHSLPTYLALAGPAPTCPAPSITPVPPPNTAQPPPRSVPLLGAACAVQALALAVLLMQRCASSAPARPLPTGGQQTAAEAAAPARRAISLRDACTSPLALLASPFMRSRQPAEAAELLAPIPEAEEEEAPQHGASRAASAGGLPAPPAGWNR